MATYTDTLGYVRGHADALSTSLTRTALVDIRLDFAKIVAARSAAGATALAAGDTMQVLRIPAKSVMLQGGLDVLVAETVNTTGTFSVGFLGGSPAAANVFANAVANNALSFTALGLAAPIAFSSADTLDLLINTAAPTNAVIRVWAILVDCVGATS